MSFLPADFQPELPQARLILPDLPDPEAIEMDVVIVGAGPGGLATAIELARLVKADAEAGGPEVNIAVLEKAAAIGDHNLSGAVINPRALRELFPDLKDEDFPFREAVRGEKVLFLTEGRAVRIPTPPTMHNAGFYTASICELCRWLGERAEAAGVQLLPGFPVDSLLVDGDRAIGVRTAPAGLERNGEQGPRFEPATDLTAKVVVLAEGSRGSITQAYLRAQNISAENPQIFALGVKEVWELKQPLDSVIHTMGWPLPGDAFGGSFMYPMGGNLASLGLVVGLDYRDASLDVHRLLQRMKLHPFFREMLEGGEMLEWGAKTIPEGGFYSLPRRRHGDGLVIVGDSAGFVDVPSLKGIHYAIQTGIYAARAIFAALKEGNTSAEGLARYDEMVEASYVLDDLRERRNMRLAFKDGFVAGGAKAALMSLTGGRALGKRIEMTSDARRPRETGSPEPFTPDGKLTFSKVDAVFRSGNRTRDDVPSHLVVGREIPPEVAAFYHHLCPAGVYELDGETLRVNAPNCVDCKATDVVGPRWTVREGGSGPAYKQM